MAGPIIAEGQRMVRPGVAFEIRTGEQPPDAGADVAGWVGRANRGPLGQPVKCFGEAHLRRVFGSELEVGNTMDGAIEAFQAGVAAVEVIRLGSAGAPAAKATHTFMDTTVAPVAVLRADAIDYGTYGNAVSVAFRDNADAIRQDAVIYYQGAQVEVFSYDPGTDGAAAAAAAVNAGSAYVHFTKLAVGNGDIATITSTALTAGANPTIVNADYGTAIETLVRRPLRAFGVDSESNVVHLIVQAAVDAAWEAGRRRIAVVSEPTSVAWDTRVADCRGFNDPAIVYVGTATTRVDDHGVTIIREGFIAAGLEAGRHSVLPLGRQLTNRPVPKANQLYETVGGIGMPGVGLDDDQLEEAIDAGMYVYAQADGGDIITDEGNTTYTNAQNPPDWATSADIGWGKSRLVLTRAQLLDDIYAAWAPMIPDLTNNEPGRESLIREAKNVIEHKYQPRGAIGDYSLVAAADPAPAGDEATFLLACQTPDGLERMRLIATFRR